MEHTPGKWKINRWKNDTLADGFGTVITDSRGHGLFSALEFGESRKVEANAWLIANAPLMLKILKDIADKGDVSLSTMLRINLTILSIEAK